MIKNENQAKVHAEKYLHHKTLIVSASGSIYANCDVDSTCETLEEQKEKYFLLKGEKSVKKNKKD